MNSISVSAALPTSPITGTVYRDYNANAQQDVREPGVANVTVTAYDKTNAIVDTQMTDRLGNYTLNTTTGLPVRLEFTTIPAYLRSGPQGAQSVTTVTFATSPASAVDLALANPGQYCPNTDPRLITSCYVLGDQSQQGAYSVIVGFPYLSGSTSFTNPNDSIFDVPGMPFALEIPAPLVGTTWGLAYQRATDSVFAAAFMKRHAGFGPGGPGAIYRINNASGANVTTASLFIDLNAVFGAPVAGVDPHPAAGTPYKPNWIVDANSYDAVGKISLGGMAMSEDDRTLWVMNLNDRQLYKLPVGIPAVAPTAAQISRYPVPQNQGDCPNPDLDIRPFAVTVEDGLVYIGVVCSAESTKNDSDVRL
jgi:hypothetical protein